VKRQWYIPVIALAVVLAVGGVFWLRTSLGNTPGALEVAGDVRSEIRVIRAPSITYPVADYAVGIPKPAGAALSAGGSPAAKRVPAAGGSRQPTVAGILAVIYVAEGDHVTIGQPLVTLDTTMLDLGVAQARTAATKAHADVAVMGDTLSTLADTKAKLASTRSKLTSTLSQLVAQRASLAAQLAQLEAAVAHMPPGPPPSPSPTSPPSPAVLIPKLRAALGQMDAGLVKLKQGLGKLATGATQLSSAKTQVTTARSVLGILAGASDIGVQLAQARVAQATITSPVNGLVTYARPRGQLAMVGTPVVRIRPDGPRLVDTYLAADQLALVRLGTPVTLTYDSSPGTVTRGRITRLGTSSAFPPTSFPTTIVHMTRATRVTVTLDDGAAVPYGTPVDLTISTR
jgi:X-X-X-Leu-X-X-Gly heptad repeat protein